MPVLIIHKDGAYNLFSTITDSPWFESALTLDQLNEIIKTEYGQNGLNNLPERLERAHAKGCSCLHGTDLRSLIVCNRAGPRETELSFDDFVAKYLTLPE